MGQQVNIFSEPKKEKLGEVKARLKKSKS